MTNKVNYCKNAAMILFAQHRRFNCTQDLTNKIVRYIHSDQSEVSTLFSLFYLTRTVSDTPSCQKLLCWKSLFAFRSYESVDIRLWCNSLCSISFFQLAKGKNNCIS